MRQHNLQEPTQNTQKDSHGQYVNSLPKISSISGSHFITENSETLDDYQLVQGERFTINKDENVKREYSPESIRVSNKFQTPQRKQIQQINVNSDIKQLMRVDQNGKISLNEDTLQYLSQITENISVLSIIGPYRSGKSFLLNRFNNSQKGFDLGSTTNPCTQGVWVWGTNALAQQPNTKTILLDTEGLFAFNRDENTDMILFLFTALMSSTMIYNTFGVINEDALERLGFLTEVGRYFGGLERKKQLSTEELSQYFPKLIWLLRDFSLELLNSSNQEITEDEYLEQTLMPKNKHYENPIIQEIHQSYINQSKLLVNQQSLRESKRMPVDNKNQIRKKIKEIFTDRTCHTLVRPVNDESQLRKIDHMDYNNLRERFRGQVESLIYSVKSGLKIKTFRQNKMNGQSFVEYIQIITNAINQEKVPPITSIWDRMSISRFNIVLNKYSDKIEQMVQTTNQSDFETMSDINVFETMAKTKNKLILEVMGEELESEYLMKLIKQLNKEFMKKEREVFEQYQKTRQNQITREAQKFESEIEKVISAQIKQGADVFVLGEIYEQFLNSLLHHKNDFALKQALVVTQRKMVQAIEKSKLSLTKKLSNLEIENSKLEGRYEASKNLLEKQKQMMTEVIEESRKNNQKSTDEYERKIKEMKEQFQEKLNDTMMQQEKERAHQHALQHVKTVQGKEEQMTSSEEIKQMLRVIQEQVMQKELRESKTFQDSEYNQLMERHQQEIKSLRTQNNLDVENVKRMYENEYREQKQKAEEYRSLLEEAKIMFLKKDAEIKILQQKVESDNRFKNSQMEFSSMLCNISDQVMHLLQKMEKKI